VTEAGHWARERLGYHFSDPEILTRALTHRSASAAHYERLEFLGDAVLGLVVTEVICEAYPDAEEGNLTRLRARLVRRETLRELALELGLAEQLRLGSGELRSGGFQRGSILADSLEAVFGAVFFDGGFPAARDVIRRVYAVRLEQLEADEDHKDPKTALQEILQGVGLPPPVYEVSRISGAAHAQMFEVVCQVPAKGIAESAQGSSRRRAEQAAAALVLRRVADEHA